MKYLLPILFLFACAAKDTDIANNAFGGEAYCKDARTEGIALCSMRDRIYVCYVGSTLGEVAYCIEAVKPVDLLKNPPPYRWSELK